MQEATLRSFEQGISVLFNYDWNTIKKFIKIKSLRAFRQIVNSSVSAILEEKAGSLFLPIFDQEIKVLNRARPISNVTRELLTPLLSEEEKRVTYLRKAGVDGLLFIKDLGGRLPPDVTEKLTIIALQEGYVLAEKISNNKVLLHEKLEDFYSLKDNAGESESPEARGFIVGGIVADQLHKPYIPIRKAKEDTVATFEGSYWYGKTKFTIDESVIKPYKKMMIIDDDLISGGTCMILIRALNSFGVDVIGVAVLIEWPQFGGRQKIKNCRVYSALKAYNPFLEIEKAKKP